MQFIANTEAEFLTTIEAIINAEIYNELTFIYALDIQDGEVNLLPLTYPCIVSFEIDEIESDNRRFAFSACKFLYMDELMDGISYQTKLDRLADIDLELASLYDERDTSGEGFPLEQIRKREVESEELERILF